MPVLIKLTFSAGRYHATPWGRHVNEGVPEWPPSPWRLLRALVAVWRRTCPELSADQVRRVLEPLAQPPRFLLPSHNVAHTRHYMPWEKKGPQDRTLVFDTFVSVGREDSVFIGWPQTELSPGDRGILAQILGNLTSLGRAESWVHAELCDQHVELPFGVAAVDDPDPVPVLCADPTTAFDGAHYPVLDPKKLAKGKVNPASFLFDCPRWHLCLDTETIHEERWPTVPGTKWINYARPNGAGATPTGRPVSSRAPVTVARLMLDGPVLPLTVDTVRVAERFRAALMGRFRIWCEVHPAESTAYRREDAETYASPTFSGKDARGVRGENHSHAHFLPLAEGNDPRRITHITVYAPAGLQAAEQAAISVLPYFNYRENESLRVQLVGLGMPTDFTAPIVQSSRAWVSVSPFVAPRHLKRRGVRRDTPHLEGPDPIAAFLELTLRESVDQKRLVQPQVTAVDPGPGLPRARDFHRARSRVNDDGMRRPFGWFKLVFPAPVPGPLCLGYGSHFGLGLFLPVAE